MSHALEVARLETLHPVLVHVTLGTLPFVVLAYGVAAWRDSERWSFAADAALVYTAGLTLLTSALGLVSNAWVPWPGGLGLWRYMHLGLGIASAVLLLTLALFRLQRRRRVPKTGGGVFVAAVVVAVVTGFTGWMGGEVLVYHGGIAVKAAGEGALAPTVSQDREPPEDLLGAMHELRGAWASAMTGLASMVVERPSDELFGRIESAAVRLRETSTWVVEEGARGDDGSALRFMAGRLASQARELEEGARDRSATAVAKSLGEITTTCAGCHQSSRWEEPRAGELAAR